MAIKKTEHVSGEPDYFSQQVAVARRFYRPPHDNLKSGITVVAGGRERCMPGYDISRTSFPYHCIEFVAGGRGFLTHSGRDFELVPGMVFQYGHAVAHRIRSSRDQPLEKYFVDFEGAEAGRILLSCNVSAMVTMVRSPQFLLTTFDELIDCGLRCTPSSDRICSALLQVLIYKIADSALPSGGKGGRAFDSYQRIRDHIRLNWERIESVEQAAAACGIDRAYASRLFKRFDHQSPAQYLTRLRMNRAAEQLSAEGMMVKQVAREAGYEDPFHFTRAFRKVYGVAPKKFMRTAG